MAAPGVIEALTRHVVRNARVVVVVAVAAFVLTTPLLASVLPRLQGGGLDDDASETSRVKRTLAAMGQGQADVIAVYRVKDESNNVDDPVVLGEIVAAVTRVEKTTGVKSVVSDVVHGAHFLTSTDRRTTAVVVTLDGVDERARLAAPPAERVRRRRRA